MCLMCSVLPSPRTLQVVFANLAYSMSVVRVGGSSSKYVTDSAVVQDLMQFMRDHPEYLPYSSYSIHHNAERSVCSRRCAWIKTDERGFIHLTSGGIEYQAQLQAAVAAEANTAGTSTAAGI